ncbi:MAG: glycine/sarcosine/betaine reductase complex component C subunit beta [Candidatus Bathyarchaeia archaeon]
MGREVVVKSVAYTLAHAPDLALYYGASQRLEKTSEVLGKLRDHLRDYETTLAYYPFQVFIGNVIPEKLSKIERPWYRHPYPDAKRFGKHGEMMPEDELYGLMRITDVFDLIWLEKGFCEDVKEKLMKNPILSKYDLNFERLDAGKGKEEIKEMTKEGALPLFMGEEVVGCVRAASKEDENQTAHIMLELLTAKATGVVALAYALDRASIQPEGIDFVIECSEEIAGDIYNRGGGGMGKSIAEALGCKNATGFDLKVYCASPVFALVQAWAQISSGLYDNVAVVGGGSVAKLGMNARDHVGKGMPVLEDVLGSVAIILSKDDGVNPVIRPMGKQDLWASSHVGHMLQSLIITPLERRNLALTDVDLFAAELQIPEILGRDIPMANYRLIAELAARRGEIERSGKEKFIRRRGVPGFAPQQGHVPSGVPIIGYAKDKILDGEMNRVMVIGKGSLFLGRITKLHDGISVLIERNPRMN